MNGRRPRVLVAHSGLQHSHQLAWALEEAGMLAAFWSGVPVVDLDGRAPELWERLSPSVRRIPVPPARRWHPVLFPLMRRVLGSLPLPSAARSALQHRLDHGFDAWVARRIARLRPDMVVCYENAALRTFRAAKRIGAVCVLDAASVHPAAQIRWLGEVAVETQGWIFRRKLAEMDLADAILTCSPFAAESYREAGCSERNVIPIVLGTELPDLEEVVKEASCPSFVFVGSLSHHKGGDLLLDTFHTLASQGLDVRLTVIGGLPDPRLAERLRALPNARHLGFIPKPALFEELARHHCMVLPSRFDAFGMVVPEALAAGVPVLISDRVGAKCILEAHPEAGWVIPPTRDALLERIASLASNAGAIEKGAKFARSAAQDYSWERYRARVVGVLMAIHHGKKSGACEPTWGTSPASEE